MSDIDESLALAIIEIYKEMGEGINGAALVCNKLSNPEEKKKLSNSVNSLLFANYKLLDLMVSRYPHLDKN